MLAEAVKTPLWDQCQARLQTELSGSLYNMWIRPLQAVFV